jgi:protein-S-isoprenylcysteine O-methyltransferase Ste14
MILRQLLSIVILPGTVTLFVPIWIARRNAISSSLPADARGVLTVLFGVIALLVGFALFGYSLYFFWTRGRGTLAPWDPPRRFVVEGPYRYVRNPMISGVIFILIGEAFILRSRPHADWAGLFAIINMIYIPLFEEPMLAARFGEPYNRYRRHVARFVPRVRPWRVDGGA